MTGAQSPQARSARGDHGGRHGRPRLSRARGGEGAARARRPGGVARRARQHGVAAGAGERLSHRVGARAGHSRQGCRALARGAVPHRRRRARRRCASCAGSSRAPCSGAGGYVSGPGGIAAWLLRIPLLIHEQNAVAGLTNRWLARFATQVLEAFPGQFRRGREGAHRRQSGARRHRRAAFARGALRRPHGARRALAGVRRQPGRAALERRRAAGAVAARSGAPSGGAASGGRARHRGGARRLQERAVEAEVLPFIDDMAAAYAWADLAAVPRGRDDRRGAASGGPRRVAGALCGRHRRSSDQERRGHGARRRRPGAARERELSAERLCADLVELTADRARCSTNGARRRARRATSMRRRGSPICAWRREGAPA